MRFACLYADWLCQALQSKCGYWLAVGLMLSSTNIIRYTSKLGTHTTQSLHHMKAYLADTCHIATGRTSQQPGCMCPQGTAEAQQRPQHSNTPQDTNPRARLISACLYWRHQCSSTHRCTNRQVGPAQYRNKTTRQCMGRNNWHLEQAQLGRTCRQGIGWGHLIPWGSTHLYHKVEARS